jgi:prevent-host-death family protein
MKSRQVTATEFKGKCLALLDEVNEQRGTITITKRGRPVAMLHPVKHKPWKSLEGILAGKLEIAGDIVSFHMPDDWTRDVENLPEYWAKTPVRGTRSLTPARRPRPSVAHKRRGKSA